MEVTTFVYGIYPRSDRLRLDYGRFERGLLSSEKLKTIIKEEKDLFYDLTDGIGMVTDPLFNWYDIFRPVALSVEGINLGPLRRYGETNTFYREPIIAGKGGLKFNALSDHEFNENPPFPMFYWGSRNILPIFPSPVAMYNMSFTDRNVNLHEFSENLLEIYVKLADEIGSKNIVIFSPKIGEHEIEEIENIGSKHGIILVSPGGIGKSDFDNTSLKFHSIIVNNIKDLELAANHSKIPGLGILDAHNTRVETKEEIKKHVEAIENTGILKNIVLTHNDYMDFLPRSIADRKVKILQEVN